MRSLKEKRDTRKPTGFDFAIADRIDFLNSDHWDSIADSASAFLSRRYLLASQFEFTDSILRRFALVYDEGRPVAIVATQSFDIDGSQLVQNPSDEKLKLPDELKRKGLSLLKRRILMCGNVHTWGPHGVAFLPGEDAGRLWPAVADVLYRIRRADKLNGQTDYVIVKDLFGDPAGPAASLESFRYRSMETEPNMVLTLNKSWTTFDDYLGSLTKKYRAAAKKTMKPFLADGFEVAIVADIAAEAARIHELYKAVVSRADVRLFEVEESTLPRLADALGSDFVTVGIREAGRLIGFVNVIRDGETAIGYYIGIDYETNSQLPIYHRLLLAVIEQAIEWNCRQVSFGRTALDAKSRLGCVPQQTHIRVRHRIPVLNFIVQQLLKNVSPNEPPERNPFKVADQSPG